MLDHINTTAPADADLTVRRAGFDKFEYVRESVRDTNLTHAEHRTLMVIWDHTDARTLEAFPGQAAIATSLGIKDRRRVGDLVKSLTRKGYLEIKRQGYSDQASGRNVSTLYGLTLPVRTDEGVGVTSTPTPPRGVRVNSTRGGGGRQHPHRGGHQHPPNRPGIRPENIYYYSRKKRQPGQQDDYGCPGRLDAHTRAQGTSRGQGTRRNPSGRGPPQVQPRQDP